MDAWPQVQAWFKAPNMRPKQSLNSVFPLYPITALELIKRYQEARDNFDSRHSL